jgi:sugar lactone lactonase YvrE
VHLLLERGGDHLLVGSSDNGKVVRVNLSDGHCKHVADVRDVSGLALDSDGALYAADRKERQIWSGPLGKKLKKYGTKLRDYPEFILLAKS